jgi:hypothetical protein
MNFRRESSAASGVEFSEAAGVKFRRLLVVGFRHGWSGGKWAKSSDFSEIPIFKIGILLLLFLP